MSTSVIDMPEGKFPLLKNLRSLVDGRIETRPGLTLVKDTGSRAVIDSLFAFSDVVNNFCAASNGTLYFNAIPTVTGFSTNGVTFCRDQSRQGEYAMVYVGDAQKMAKVASNGSGWNMGIMPPTQPPVVTNGAPAISIIDDGGNAASWTLTNNSASAIQGSTTGTFDIVLYDSGTSGWVTAAISSNPSGMTGVLTEGVQLYLDYGGGANQKSVVIHEQMPTVTVAMTIASIVYDSGTTGVCTVVPSVFDHNILPNVLLHLNGSEYVRVTDVFTEPSGARAFRCSTTVAHAAGESIAGVTGAVRFYVDSTPANYSFRVNSWNTNFYAGIGSATRTVSLNLASIGGRPSQDDDQIEVCLFSEQSTGMPLIEGKIEFDVGDGTFQRDYFTASFRPSDVQLAVAGAVPSLETKQSGLQSRIVDESELTVNRMLRDWHYPQLRRGVEPVIPTTASVQLNPVLIGPLLVRQKMKQFTRVGADQSKGWGTVSAVRIQLNFSQAGSATVTFESMYLRGGYGPDPGQIGLPYYYRYVYRSTVFGARSIPSPPNRTGLMPKRDAIAVGVPRSSDAQVDVIDVYRFGGALASWRYVATLANGTTSYTDELADIDIASNDTLEFDNYAPFPQLDFPRSMTVNVTGNRVVQTSGDTFNTSWAPGTTLRINGILYTLYAPPSDSTHAEIVESAGTQTGVSCQIDMPLLVGKPLPYIFGPINGYILGCGSATQPGTLFWTKAGVPDCASDANNLLVTSSAEPLLGGCVYDGRGYLWSQKRMFVLTPTNDPAMPFAVQEVPSGRGLWRINGTGNPIAVGDRIYFVSDDGIYASGGGGAELISDDISPIFKRAGFSPTPDATGETISPSVLYPSLTWADGFLFYDVSGCSFVCDLERGAWYYDVYPGVMGPNCRAAGGPNVGAPTVFCGGSDGKVYSVGGTDDGGTAITGTLATPMYNFGDPRAVKWMEEAWFNGVGTVAYSLYVDDFGNAASASGSLALSASTRDGLVSLNNGVVASPVHALGMRLSLAPGSYLNGWELTFYPQPDSIVGREQYWDDLGYPGPKYIRGVTVRANTFGANVTLNIFGSGDGVTPGTNLVINHNGDTSSDYSVGPFVAHEIRVVAAAGAGPYQLFGMTWIFDKYPALASIQTSWDDAGYPGAKFVQGVVIRGDTNNLAVGVNVLGDGGTTMAMLSATHNGQEEVAYSFPPFVAHELALLPQGPMRVFAARWVWEPMPELATTWTTQPTTHDLKGYQILRDAHIAHISTADITLTLTIDGVAHSFTIANGGGIYVKTYLQFPSLKGKAFTYSLTSPAGFRLFQRDCEVRVKSWGSPETFIVKNPFGDVSRTNGATI